MIGFSLIWSCVLVAYAIRSVTGADLGNIAFYTPNDLVTISVQPNAPAERAGVRDGDRIDGPAMTLRDRLIVLGGANVAGQPVTLAVRRNGTPMTFRYRLDSAPLTPAAIVSRIGFLVLAIVALLLSAVVVARAPTGDAACLWLFSLLSVSSTSVTTYLPSTVAVADLVFNDVCFAAGLSGALLLAVESAGEPTYRVRDRVLVLVAGGALLAFALETDSRFVILGDAPPIALQWLSVSFLQYALVYLAAAMIATRAAIRARGSHRIRLQWYASGFALWVLANLIAVAAFRIPDLFFSNAFLFVPVILFLAGQLTIAYPIVRQDLFGVDFVINRAAIYAVVTGVIVGAFAGGNWVIGTALKSAGLALPVDVVLAGLAGLSLNFVQRRINVIVDRVFFRSRYDAARRLRRVARALTHATTASVIADAVTIEPCEALGLRTAAFLLQTTDGTFGRVAASNWPADATASVAMTERFITHVIGAGETPLRIDDVPHPPGFPHGPLRPRLLFPLWSRRELIGFAVYGTHLNGAQLDPEEIEEIERVTTAASAAYDRVAAATLRQTQDELAALRAAYASLLERSRG